jgi:hypothetical protein
MVAILNQKWSPKYKDPAIWAKFGFQHDRVKNEALIISCYVLTLFFIHTTSTCIVRLWDICSALRYRNQYVPLFLDTLDPLVELVVLTNPVISHERQGSVYDKWNISLVMCDTDMP